jgi:hypothetical protein
MLTTEKLEKHHGNYVKVNIHEKIFEIYEIITLFCETYIKF